MAYYYQIGRDINNSDKASELANWRTTDLEKLPKDTCMNINSVGFKKSGSKTMDKDDNEAMFIPKGYAIMGYDHNNCEETGAGVQFYHGYHTSNAENSTATSAINAISGNKPGGVYNYYGPGGGNAEDQPRNIAGKLSSWKVYDLNDKTGFSNVMRTIDDVDSNTTGTVASNKLALKRILCNNVDKTNFETAYTDDIQARKRSFTEECEGILRPTEILLVWPDETPDVSAAPDTYSDPDDDDTYSDPDDDDTYSDPDDDDPDDDDPDDAGPDWLLYGGIAAGVCSVVVVLIIIVLMMKKKKVPLNSKLNV
jgi:hypothetical protein